jgi:hypothetical protein
MGGMRAMARRDLIEVLHVIADHGPRLHPEVTSSIH